MAKKAKFTIGDIVVITVYGTVGKITDVQFIENEYYYEVNKSEDLYEEASLAFLTEFNGQIILSDEIEIEYNYFIGDLVKVKGYGDEWFRIIGFRTEIWRYKEDAWEESIYELVRVSDGEWLEAAEEEITTVISKEKADYLKQKIELRYLLYQDKQELQNDMSRIKKDKKTKTQKEIIDGLLDVYNDYRVLYELFYDEEYKHVMDLAMENLKRLTNNKNENYLGK
ncbi:MULTISPECIES: hypothetical protein [Sutcliffiella]|uniref:hypothetical protein n=1 Tax=Sutcliffiella TaxID=2837511 RepID=UPI000AAE09B5|nr:MULTISPECIES: hypothetical protein [Sutcliffiella]WBL12984.1 hypothetical protein O1A01_13655 [Sutcliffiella sp. NC1]